MDEPSLWIVLAVATGATYLWRGLGVAVASRISPEGDFASWMSCVAYAMLAGLIARMILFPAGVLGETLLEDRLAATAAGLSIFFIFKRNLLLSTVAATVLFIAIIAVRGA
ncbi:MAG: AzlD domain-containing protein [Rhodospirillales bacterium]|nr:AzlD domain-containing protein [Rhodospirillales bacterium]